MKSPRIIIWIIVLGVTVFLCCGILNNYARKRALQLRFEDVQLLTDVYISQSISNQSPTMDDLISELKRRGRNLNSPIPLDMHLPCYKIITNGVNARDPSAVIIEETENVDAKNIVKAFADGSIKVENNRTPHANH